MRKAAVGVDIGGTSVKLGLVDSTGKMIRREIFMTNPDLGRKKTLDILIGFLADLIRSAREKGFQVSGIGIGAPGPVDVERGFVYFFPNIRGWRNAPLAAILKARLGFPVRVDNDANAMAFGEFLFGAGHGAENVITLTLGTGIGGGIILNGKLFHGSRFSAAEIGHLIINEKGPLCACGNRGCVEAYVGNGYFVRGVRRRLKAGRHSVLKKWVFQERKELTPLLVAEAARKGDRFAKEIWKETGEHLGTALAGLVNILNPEKIILGGGIAQNGELIFRPVKETIRKKSFPIAAQSVRVVPAALGTDAGIIGAAALAFHS